jgi:hypothetical protein
MYHDDDRLNILHDERIRCAQAIDDLEWDDDFAMADLVREELRYLDALHEKGEVYVPNF